MTSIYCSLYATCSYKIYIYLLSTYAYPRYQTGKIAFTGGTLRNSDANVAERLLEPFPNHEMLYHSDFQLGFSTDFQPFWGDLDHKRQGRNLEREKID